MAQHVRGEAHGNAAITNAIVRKIRSEYAKGTIGYGRLALLIRAIHGVTISRAQVRRVVLKESWAHVE